MMSPIPTDQADAETVCLSLLSEGIDMAVNVGMGGISGWVTTLVTEFIATPLPHAVNKLKVQVLQRPRETV